MRLLVVDDDGKSRRILVSALQACGHVVESVSSTDDALGALESAEFAGVLCEMRIGEITAIQFLEQLREHHAERPLGFIVVSSPGDVAEIRKTLAEGADGYISKPLDIETLGPQVENLLKLSGGGADRTAELHAEPELHLDVPLRPSLDDGGELCGQTLDDKYVLEELVGHGGMGEVYRARHVYLDREVAVKVLPRRHAQGSRSFSRFIREARIIAQVRNRHVVGIHDFGFTPWQTPYLVMEHVDGIDLQRLLEHRGALPIEDVEDIAAQCVFGLTGVHRIGVLHLDVKPSNVMLLGDHADSIRRPLEVKLLDFGIARFDVEAVEGQIGRMLVTGTVAYMSPEQCRGDALGPASDLYSMGAVIFEMLTGRTPFLGVDRSDYVRQHLMLKPQSPRVFRPDTPPYLEELVMCLLAKDPGERTSADALLETLLANADLSLKTSSEELPSLGELEETRTILDAEETEPDIPAALLERDE